MNDITGTNHAADAHGGNMTGPNAPVDAARVTPPRAAPRTAAPSRETAPGAQTMETERSTEAIAHAIALAALVAVSDGADVLMTTLTRLMPAWEIWQILREASDPTRELLARAVADEETRMRFMSDAKRKSAWTSRIAQWAHRARDLPRDGEELRALLSGEGRYRIVTPADACWPGQLDDLDDAPLCLWTLGDARCLAACRSMVAVVGSREANAYGVRAARSIASTAASAGHVVVSGGALGIDAAAHHAALEARRGATVAVMAGGLVHMGPSSNLGLFDDIIAAHGAVISEVAPQTVPLARRFLVRNRIIAALAGIVVVAQARYRSGAINTATHAARLNRAVMAVPGDIDAASNAGCNELIYNGKAILLPRPGAVLDMIVERHDPPRDGELFDPSQTETAPRMGVSRPCLVEEAADTAPARADANPTDVDSTNEGPAGESAVPPPPGAGSDMGGTIVKAIRALRRQRHPTDAESIRAYLRAHGFASVTVRQTATHLGTLEMEGKVTRQDNGTFRLRC